MVRCVIALGLTAAAFGPAYAHVLLRAVYGPRWGDTQAPAVLAAYSGYTALLAANGILEAFVHAAAGAAQLVRINAWMVVAAAAHVALSLALVSRGGALGGVFPRPAALCCHVPASPRFQQCACIAGSLVTDCRCAFSFAIDKLASVVIHCLGAVGRAGGRRRRQHGAAHRILHVVHPAPLPGRAGLPPASIPAHTGNSGSPAGCCCHHWWDRHLR